MSIMLDRRCLHASGPDASDYLQSMVSNDIEKAVPGGGVYALLLTAKARLIADLEIFGVDGGYVIASDPAAADQVLATLLRARFRRKVEFEPSGHAVVWGEADGALARLETPIGPYSLLAAAPERDGDPGEWELARIEAGIPRYLHEFDGDSMPAEAGLVGRGVSFTKGCYPGQEPVARLHYRGHANRGVRGLRFADGDPPAPGAPVVVGEREVGRVTSIASSPRFGPIGLAVLRREVEDGASVLAGEREAVVEPLPFAADEPA
jgi:folate-binding protein YgfZ